MMAAFHTSVWMALWNISSSKPCKAAPKSKKTVLTAMHRFITDADTPFVSAGLHSTYQKKGGI